MPKGFWETTEPCDGCGRETTHVVEIEKRQETTPGLRNSEAGQQPWRVTECSVCGEETQTRWDHAR